MYGETHLRVILESDNLIMGNVRNLGKRRGSLLLVETKYLSVV